jgi:hypothetical protein
MTAKEELVKVLRARQPYCLTREARKMAWAGTYAALLDQIVGWASDLGLPELVHATRRASCQICDDLGLYRDAPTLDLDLCGALISVEPLTRTPPGALGRVAVSRASQSRVLVLRAEGSWEVEPPEYGYKHHLWDPIPLTADTFYDLLCDLLR